MAPWHTMDGVRFSFAAMSRVILFNKPHGVICQFSPDGLHATLKDYVPVPDVYPAGRLDTDSEGLVILTDDGKLQHAISHPRHKLPKTYWVQVEGVPAASALDALRRGVRLKDGLSRPARVHVIAEPFGLWPRHPPIRFRKVIPTTGSVRFFVCEAVMRLFHGAAAGPFMAGGERRGGKVGDHSKETLIYSAARHETIAATPDR